MPDNPFHLDAADYSELQRAHGLLEGTSLAIRLVNYLGRPIEFTLERLPSGARDLIHGASKNALEKAAQVALSTLDGAQIGTEPRRRILSDLFHKAGAVATGTVGGAFGLAALPVELPISTVIMLRSIADIARSQGEELADPEARLQCVSVFALGGRSKLDDDSELGYLAVRAALAAEVSAAARFAAKAALGQAAQAPALVKLVGSLAARFSIPVGEKLVAQAMPLLGALGGASVNYVFIDHFQDMADGHFTVRRLERKYGASRIEQAYRRLSGE